MSVHISISNNKNQKCNSVMKKLYMAGFDCRSIQTMSIVNNKLENGCLITFDKEYNSVPKLTKVWDTIKNDYNCAHLKIDGQFNGCIHNYLRADFCPGNK